MELVKILQISAAGLRAQGTRLRVIAENLANANTTAQVPGGEPYRRKLVSFENVLDRELGVQTVHVAGIRSDRSPFGKRYDPGHPAADADGYVLMPNVNGLIESTDMREALRSYEANLSVIETSRTIIQRTIDLLAR
ncbi:MAG: flagellar basal body rod protein FlgC [Alphaproteobacteria bacterium]